MLLQKKWKKGRTISEAAEDLEEDVPAIQPFYDLIAQYPDEEGEDILARYNESKVSKVKEENQA